MLTPKDTSANETQQTMSEFEQVKKENSFQKALKDTHILLRHHGIKSPTVFISYAWEDESSEQGKNDNKTLQDWLQRISKDLALVGTKVFLDIEGIKGKMAHWMEQGIEESDYILLVGTPRYKARASAPTTNVAFEYQHILKKLSNSNNPAILLPLLYSGDFANSFPGEMMQYLIRDFRELERYYQHLLGLVKPIGMVSHLYPDLEKGGPYHQEYLSISDYFFKQLLLTQAEARVYAANKAAFLPQIPYELPASSLYFVGRQSQMQQLKQQFASPGLVKFAIQGMGGTGKSQLAAEYAHQSKTNDKPYRLIRWLKADSREHIQQAYFHLGEDIGIKREDFKDSPEAYKRAIDRQLLRYERILLIYDNVESLADIEDYQPRSAEDTHVHLLLTSRRLLDLPKVMVREFSPVDVQTYLQQRFDKDIPSPLANQLGEELGYLPLALVQAAAYMVKYNKPIDAFLKLLQSTGKEKALSSDLQLQSVATLWNITMTKLSSQGLEALRLCAYLDPDNIPLQLLEQFIGEDDADEVLYELRSHSLLVEVGSEHVLRVHRLLQESLRRQLPIETAKAIVEKGIRALKQVIGEERYKPASETHSFWQQHAFVFVQVNRLIVQNTPLKMDEGLLAHLYEWAGDYQQHIVLNYMTSLASYQQSLDIRRMIYGEAHQATADALYDLGCIHEIQARYPEALVNYEKALAIFQRVFGDKPHAAIAGSLNNIGSVYDSQGEYAKALDYYEQSFAIDKAVYGDKHPTVIQSLNNIKDVHKAQQSEKQAPKFSQKNFALYNTTGQQNLSAEAGPSTQVTHSSTSAARVRRERKYCVLI